MADTLLDEAADDAKRDHDWSPCHEEDSDDIDGDDLGAHHYEDKDTQVTDAHTRMQMHIKAENDEEGGEDTE